MMATSSKNKSQSPVADRLPERLPSASRRERVRMTVFGGLDVGEGGKGRIAEMYNLSSRAAPALATRPEKELLMSSPPPGYHRSMAVMGEDLYMVRDIFLYRVPQVLKSGQQLKPTLVGMLSGTEKHMTVFDGHLLVFPDKVYMDEKDGRMRPMELDTGVLEDVRFCGNTVTLPMGNYWSELGFLEGDSVYVSQTNGKIPNGYYRLTGLYASLATVAPDITFPPRDDNGVYNENASPEVIVSPARLQRIVPDMDGLTVLGDRLCGYKGRTVYIGGEGSPFSWGQNLDDKHGATVLQSCTDGDFTACAACGDELVLFKPAAVVRVTGTRSDNFMMTEIKAAGIPAGLGRTLCEMNGDLYYHGFDEAYVYRHNAKQPERMGRIFSGRPTGGCGVAYEEGYYVCVSGNASDGSSASGRYFYDVARRAWYVDQDEQMIDGIRLGAYLCSVDKSGVLWLSRNDGERAGTLDAMNAPASPVHSFVSFVPDYTNYPDGCRPTDLYLRATSKGTCKMRVLMSFADGRRGRDADLPAVATQEQGRENASEICCITENMQNRLLHIPLPPRRCDYVVLALEMLGDWVIHEITLEYEIPKG